MDTGTSGPHQETGVPFLPGQAAQQLAEVCGHAWPESGPWRVHQELLKASCAAASRLAKRLQACLAGEALLPHAEVSFDGSAVVVRDHMTDAEHRFRSIRELAAFCGELCPGAADHVDAVASELQHAFEHECLCLAFRDSVWAGKHGHVPSLWRWVHGEMARGALESRLLFWEQVAAFGGHPRHPMAKSKLPLSPLEAAHVAPEFAPTVMVRLLAVRSGLLRVFPSTAEWQDLWAARCPEAVRCLKEQLPPEEAASDFCLVPLHPLNEPRVRELYGEELEAGHMVLLQGTGPTIPCTPTLSMRTVVPHAPGLEGLRFKLPVPVQATSLARYVSPVEVSGSVIAGRALRQLPLAPELAWLPEDFAVHLRFGDGAESEGGAAHGGSGRTYTYEEARYCSCILRASPATLEQEGCRYAPLAAMFARPQGDEAPTVWCDFWREEGVRDGPAWFSAYARVVIRAQLSALLAFGVAMEAHQQNSLLEFAPGGALRRLVYQELGGGIFWDHERLKLLPVDFSAEVYERDDMLEPASKCVACVRHSMLQSHLLPLLREVALFFQVPADGLRGQLRHLLESEAGCVAQLPEDRLEPTAFAAYQAQVLQGLLGRGQAKALLRMRLLQTKNEIYVPAESGLVAPE